NYVTAFQLAPDDHIAFHINAMDLKNRLCDVETDRRNSLHGPVLRIRSPHGDHVTYVPVEEPSTASFAEVAGPPRRGRPATLTPIQPSSACGKLTRRLKPSGRGHDSARLFATEQPGRGEYA